MQWKTAILAFAATLVICGGTAVAMSQASGHGMSCERGLDALSVRRGSVCVERTLPLTDRVDVLRAADAALPGVELSFVRVFERIPQIRVYASVGSFEEALGAAGQTQEMREQLGGSASAVMDPEGYRILVNWQRVIPGGIEGVLAHELTHSMLRDLGVAVGTVPIWFDEGLAMLAQRGGAMLTRDQAAHYLETSIQLSDLATVTGWSRHSPVESYGIATAALTVLRERIGDKGLRQMYSALATGRTFDTALFLVTRGTVAEFEASLPAALRAGR